GRVVDRVGDSHRDADLPLSEQLDLQDRHLFGVPPVHVGIAMRSVSFPLRSTLLACACLTLLASPAVGQPGPRLDISITPVTTTFPLSDPDTVPIVAATPVQITYRIRQTAGPWTLTLLADGDLLAGPSTVDISNVAWV